MRKSPIMGVFFCLLLAVVPARAAAKIDQTTRNHATSAENVLLAEDRAAKLPIVISPKADAQTKLRAGELAAYLERITCAKFEIKTGTDGPGIFVGTLQEFPTASAVEGLKIHNVYDGREAFAIRTEDGCVKLLGATSLGVSHAVSRFLELLGCRWFFQGPAWEVIPRAAKLTFNINETDRPEVLSRQGFTYTLHQQFEKSDPDSAEAAKSWLRKNRVAKGFVASAGHCAHNVVERFPKEFEAHPEYRALIKDKDGAILRTGTGPEGDWNAPVKPKFGSKSWGKWGQLCVTNPGLQKLAIQYAEEWLDKHPEADMVGVGPDDGGWWCTCPECAKLGNPGNQAFYLANKVGKSIQKSHPGKLVGLLAYSWHADPPNFPLESNVYVELTTSLITNSKYGFDDLLELWPSKCKHFGVYDYWAVYDWTRDRLPSGRTGNTRYVAEELPRYVKRGISALSAECGTSWGSQGLGNYLAAKVLWNSSTDTEALKNDFYDKAFGPAAKAMKTYYDRVDLGNGPLIGPALYRACLNDLETAEKAAVGRPDVLARIGQLKQYQVYVYLLGRESDKTAKPEDRKQFALEVLRWNYRMRNTYMTFWTFFAGFTTRQWSEEFKEPSWDWYKMHQAKKADLIPYRDPNAEIGAEEINQRFKEMKRYYGEVPKVTQVDFGKHLVAPEWSEKKPSSGPTVTFHGPYLMALASLKGEPLRFSVHHGVIYKEMPQGVYVLEDCEGRKVAQGNVPHGLKEMEFKVPAAGVYYFRYDDRNAGSRFIPAKEQRAAFVPEKSRVWGYSVSGDMWTWFYVPKGTKEILFYAQRCGGGILGIRDSKGRWIGEITAPEKRNDGRYLKADGSYRTIPVPEGTDGAMWTLHCSPGLIRFFNIPTILSLRSDAPFVPDDLAKRDGLK